MKLGWMGLWFWQACGSYHFNPTVVHSRQIVGVETRKTGFCCNFGACCRCKMETFDTRQFSVRKNKLRPSNINKFGNEKYGALHPAQHGFVPVQTSFFIQIQYFSNFSIFRHIKVMQASILHRINSLFCPKYFFCAAWTFSGTIQTA